MMEYDIKEFDEIRPYEAGEMQQAFHDLLNDRQFSLVLKGFAPWLPKGLRNGLLRLAFTGIKTPLDFQKRFMKPVSANIPTAAPSTTPHFAVIKPLTPHLSPLISTSATRSSRTIATSCSTRPSST